MPRRLRSPQPQHQLLPRRIFRLIKASDRVRSGCFVSRAGLSPRYPSRCRGDLDQACVGDHQKLDWRRSIVDLLKLLKLDSSFAARKQLATELHYTGATTESAAMNVWLHREVMRQLAANGGKVPDDLKH
jgi:hypothetical protein